MSAPKPEPPTEEWMDKARANMATWEQACHLARIRKGAQLSGVEMHAIQVEVIAVALQREGARAERAEKALRWAAMRMDCGPTCGLLGKPLCPAHELLCELGPLKGGA